MKETYGYFGDGVYAAFDGSRIILRANCHAAKPAATDEIVVEPAMLTQIQRWIHSGCRDHSSGLTFKEINS